MRTEINVVTGVITEHEDYEDYGQYVIPADKNKAMASSLLLETDWVTLPDVLDATILPYLTNQSEYLAYRAALRVIAVDPIDGDMVFPVKPISQWVK
jgi:hypothetical protein